MRAFAPVALTGRTIVRDALAALVAALGLCAAQACEGGLFAPQASSSGLARLSIVATLAPTGGSANAFDRVDALRLRLTRGGSSALDTVLAFRATGDETHVVVALPLQVLLDTARYEVELRSAGAALFASSGSVVLRRGETTALTIVLAPVASALQLSAPTPAFTSLGDTAWAHGAAVFSTGDTLRSVHPAWASLDQGIVSAGPDSMLVARAEGVARIRGSWGDFSQTLSVTVTATVTRVSVTPRDTTLRLSDAPLRFTAVARDRRGNALARPFTWSSSNATVARVDATGLVTPVAPGATYIAAAVGGIRDSIRLTVTGLPPTAPSALTATGTSARQISLAWSDNSGDETGFRIERCTGAGCTDFTEVAVVGANATAYADTGLARATAYAYRLRAYNQGGNSSYSNVAAASTTAGQAPVLSGGSVTLIQAVDPACYYAAMGISGSSHRISFNYSDVDGDVVLALSAIGGSFVGYPSGWSGPLVQSSLRNPSLSGTGSAGQIQFTLCFIFQSDQYDDVTVTLTDAASFTGTLSPVRLMKPVGGN